MFKVVSKVCVLSALSLNKCMNHTHYYGSKYRNKKMSRSKKGIHVYTLYTEEQHTVQVLSSPTGMNYCAIKRLNKQFMQLTLTYCSNYIFIQTCVEFNQNVRLCSVQVKGFP